MGTTNHNEELIIDELMKVAALAAWYTRPFSDVDLYANYVAMMIQDTKSGAGFKVAVNIDSPGILGDGVIKSKVLDLDDADLLYYQIEQPHLSRYCRSLANMLNLDQMETEITIVYLHNKSALATLTISAYIAEDDEVLFRCDNACIDITYLNLLKATINKNDAFYGKITGEHAYIDKYATKFLNYLYHTATSSVLDRAYGELDIRTNKKVMPYYGGATAKHVKTRMPVVLFTVGTMSAVAVSANKGRLHMTIGDLYDYVYPSEENDKLLGIDTITIKKDDEIEFISSENKIAVPTALFTVKNSDVVNKRNVTKEELDLY